MIEDFHLLRPLWLLLLPVLLGFIYFWYRNRANNSHWESAIDATLLAVLIEPKTHQRTKITAIVLAIAALTTCTALAGPTWQRIPQPVSQSDDSLVILLDLSLSMFAEDVAPSRLVRAKQKIADVLRTRSEGFTALVAYAGDAHIVAPLTDDTKTIENLLSSLTPEIMPVFGSKLANGLELAFELFTNAHATQGRVLLVTDGVDRLADINERRNRNFPITILGIGTPQGGPIPLDQVQQRGQVLKNQRGAVIQAKLDVTRLKEAAEIGYGRYRTISLGDDDLDSVLATPLPNDAGQADAEREFDTWEDQGYWLTLLLLPLLWLGFRRGVLVVCALLLTPVPGHAGLWEDLWQNKDQQGLQELNAGSPERAATLFTQPGWQATAKYRYGEYEGAAEQFLKDPQADGQYNLGNSLAHLGMLKEAIAAYDATLEQAPEHEDALHNKAIVEDLLEQQQQEQSSEQNEDQNDQEDQDSNNEQSSTDNSEDQNQPEQDDQQDSQSDQPTEDQAEPPPDQSESEATETEESQASRSEQEEALEQWLRRVPDDPGGLLRRKFQYETKQRLRNGDYRSKQSDKIW